MLGGVVGYNLPPVRPARTDLRPGDAVAFATDGIEADYSASLTPGLPAQRLAERILSRHGRATDDALAAVVRYRHADTASVNAPVCTRNGLRGSSSWGSARVGTNVPTQRPTTIRLRTSLFQEATEIVDQEYGSDLSLDEIARRVASSRRQLQRAYAEIGQTTFRDHLTRVRMEKAAELLDHARPHRARGRAPRRLPPAGPVREGLPAPPRRRPV